MPKKIAVGNAPMSLPFSQGIKYGDFLFVSGQGPFGKDGKVQLADIRTQTKLTLENFRRIVEEAGSSMDQVVQTTVYLSNLDDFQAMNEVYTTFFHDPKPARATVKAELLFGMKVEVQGIAAVGEH